jgi:ribonuclease HI
LRENYGNFDAFMTLSEDAKTELLWWIDNIMGAQKVLITPSPEIILTTDASNIGWGAVLRDQQTGGHWSPQEQEFHINYLELKAVLLGLKSLCSKCTATHIRVQSDNTTAVAYINSMGGIKSESCNDMASQIWEWCITKQIWLSACHIPGAENVEADTASRQFKDSVEWSLSTEVFQSILSYWGPFDIDLFA